MNEPVLVVIRGNSASGKSTAAASLQRRFGRGMCAVVSQDLVRRQMMREFDEPDQLNIELIAYIAQFCLSRGVIAVVEGILHADRYGAMLQRLAADAPRSLFYAYDLSLAETLSRHAGRPKASSIPAEQLRQWYHGWQPLAGMAETRFDASWTVDAVTERIRSDITAARAVTVLDGSDALR